MKYLLSTLYSCLVFIFFFTACSSEPVFPDPGLDQTKDVKDTVRRDTIETYYLTMKAKVPNKVHSILILDGINYEEIERVDDYNGQSEFLLSYPVDLKHITDKEKTMHFIVKVIDQDMRSYNKGFSLTVKPFSAPTISISGVDGTLGLVSPVFELNAFFETGLNTIRNYQVLFENKVVDEGDIEGGLSEYRYSKTLNLPMKKGEEYDLKIILSDNVNNTNDEVVKVRLIDMKKPIQIFDYTVSYNVPKLRRIWDLVYDEVNPDLLNRIDELSYTSKVVEGVTQLVVKKYNYYFSYTDFGLVSEVEYKYQDEELNEIVLEDEWSYLYDQKMRVTEAKKNIETKYDMKFGEWFDDNRVKGYAYTPDYPTLEKTNWHQHASGEEILADVWNINNKPGIITKLSAIAIPSYLPAIPAFIPDRPSAVLDNLQILLMCKYGPETIHVYDPKLKDDYDSYATVRPEYEYAYITNLNGRLDKIVRKKVSVTGTRTIDKEYLFVYE